MAENKVAWTLKTHQQAKGRTRAQRIEEEMLRTMRTREALRDPEGAVLAAAGVVMPDESLAEGIRRARKREALGLPPLRERRRTRRIRREDAPWAKETGPKPKGQKTGRKASRAAGAAS